MMPLEASSLIGAIGGISELFKGSDGSKPVIPQAKKTEESGWSS
jgi:hypothetical protein